MSRPTLAVWKFASCDGCQLTLLDCEDELLAVAEQVTIAHFLEATREVRPGPYDVSLVEGSITTADDVERIHRVREMSRNAGHDRGVRHRGRGPGPAQLRRRRRVHVGGVRPARVHRRRWRRRRRSRRTWTSTSSCAAARSTGASCWRSSRALLVGRKPNIPAHSVCFECKQRGNVCVVVAHGTPCLGPVTHAGCGALCPAYERGCYGCFGPMETPNAGAQVGLLRAAGMSEADVLRVFRTFNAGAPAFIELSRVTVGPPPAAGPADVRQRRADESSVRSHARRPCAGPGRGRGRDARAGARRRRRATYGWRSTSRHASSRPSCAGGATPSRPTSPHASVGSARWRTR